MAKQTSSKKRGPNAGTVSARVPRTPSQVLSDFAGIPAYKIKEAQEIQMSVTAKLKPGEAHPLGIWSGGCYYVATKRQTKKCKYGTYWRLVKCVA